MRRCVQFGVLLALTHVGALAAQGAPVVVLPHVRASVGPLVGTTGQFIVEIGDRGTAQMAGFTIALRVLPRPGSSGSVVVTGVDQAPGALISSLLGPSFSDTGSFVFISDVTDAGTVPVVDGALVRVQYAAAPATAGLFDVAFLSTPVASELLDAGANTIAATFVDGSVTVSLVPLPAAAWQGVCLLAFWGMLRLGRGLRRGSFVRAGAATLADSASKQWR